MRSNKMAPGATNVLNSEYNDGVAVSETSTPTIYSDKPCPRLSSDLWRRRGFFHSFAVPVAHTAEHRGRMIGVRVKTVKPFADLTFTKFPNDVLDYVMPYVSPNAWKVLCLIMRKTDGWHKPEDDISYSQITEGTGIASNATVSAALRELKEQGMVISRKASRRAPVTYRLNSDYELSVTEIVRVVQKLNNSVVQKSDTQKKEGKKPDPSTAALPSVVETPAPYTSLCPDGDDPGIHEEASRTFWNAKSDFVKHHYPAEPIQ